MNKEASKYVKYIPKYIKHGNLVCLEVEDCPVAIIRTMSKPEAIFEFYNNNRFINGHQLLDCTKICECKRDFYNSNVSYKCTWCVYELPKDIIVSFDIKTFRNGA